MYGVMYLTKIMLERFKSHKKTAISPKLITILIGPNSSGKSSILQSLLILKSSLNADEDKRKLPVTKTDSFDLGDFEDIVTNRDEESDFTIQIEGVQEYNYDDENIISRYAYDVNFLPDEKNKVSFRWTIGSHEIDFAWNASRHEEINLFNNQTGEKINLPGGNPHAGINPKFYTNSGDKKIDEPLNHLFKNGKYTRELLNEFYYVPFNRTATSYGVTLTSDYRNMVSINPTRMMSSMISKLSKDLQLLDKVSECIKEISGKSIRTRNLDLDGNDQGVTINFDNHGTSNAIANEGTGLNQLILLLVTLIISPKNAIIAIDEPEIHLHPGAQSKLAKIILNIAKKENKQIIFTTHSEHMIYPFLASVSSNQDKSLTENELAVYYFNLDEETNLTNTEELKVNENGQLDGGLKGFWDADLKIFSDFLGDSDE